MAIETTPGVQQALLFMPDISGFTEFVNTTEINHAQSIIQEVLEIIIKSNRLRLQVGEIEGDAVFFYRPGRAPAFHALLEQVEIMFTHFHQHLMQYEKQRICPCAACVSACKLKLKIIAHFGQVGEYTIQDHQKLFGKDVIIIHRLLKNNIDKHEYALLTNDLVNACFTDESLPPWYSPVSGSEEYDVGTIEFAITDLQPLVKDLPAVEFKSPLSYKQTKVAFTIQKRVHASIAEVFAPIFDLSIRPQWMEGIQAVKMMDEGEVNRVGIRHKCISSGKNDPVIITEKAELKEGEIELVEMEEKGRVGTHYLLSAIDEKETNLSIELLVKDNLFFRLLFMLFWKNSLKKKLSRSLQKLENYLEKGDVKTLSWREKRAAP
jgi:hypothetical protein